MRKIALFDGVGLSVGVRCYKGLVSFEVLFDLEELGIALELNAEAARIVELGDQAEIGKADGIAERVAAAEGVNELGESIEAESDPVS